MKKTLVALMLGLLAIGCISCNSKNRDGWKYVGEVQVHYELNDPNITTYNGWYTQYEDLYIKEIGGETFYGMLVRDVLGKETIKMVEINLAKDEIRRNFKYSIRQTKLTYYFNIATKAD